MKTELPHENLPARFRAKSLAKSTLTFALHQFIGMYGVPFTAPLVFGLGFKFLFLFGFTYSRRDFYSRVTETPYFPVQVLFALFLGWLIASSVRHKSMLWVWVLPLAILIYSFIKIPISVFESTSVLSELEARLSHFFGWGCRPLQHCLDQVVFTLPFYSSLSYSLGAVLARRTTFFGRTPSLRLTLALISAGLIILLAIGIDLILSVRQTGWQRGNWMILATPTGLGIYLLYISSVAWRQSVRVM